MQEFFSKVSDTAYDTYFGEGATKKAKDLLNDPGYAEQAEKNRVKRFNEREDELETSSGLDDKAMDKYQESKVKALEKAGLTSPFAEETYTESQQVFEKVLNVTNHQGNANQNHTEILPYTCLNGYYQKIRNKNC